MSPQPNEPLSQDELLQQLGPDIDSLLKNRVSAEFTAEKDTQYLRLRKADMYNRGLQFGALTLNNGYLDYQQAITPNGPISGATPDRGLYDYNFDIITSYRRKYQAVLGLRPFFNSKAVADDPESEADRMAAKQANLCATWVRPIWNTRIKNIELFNKQWRAGTVFAYIPFIADKQLFGEVEEQKLGQQMVTLEPAGYVCPNCRTRSEQPLRQDGLNGEGEAVQSMACPVCGTSLSDLNWEPPQELPIPVDQGKAKYPGSGPALYLEDGFRVTVPFDCPADITKASYLNYEKEENQGLLLQIFGETLRKKLKEAAANSDMQGTQQGVMTRSAAASLTGTPRSMMTNRWTYSRTWLTPAIFEYIDAEPKRKLLQSNFPDGLKVHKVNDLTVRLEAENLADVWVAIPPEPGDTIYHDPVCWAILGHQDIKNDLGNIGISLLERGLPAFVADPDVLNVEALNSKAYSPMEVIEAKPGVGARLDSAIKMLPPATFPEHMMPFDQQIEANAQQNVGMLPAVWGGGERQPTAEGQRTALNQALMQLGVPGEYAQFGFAQIFFKACKQVEKYAPKAFRVATSGSAGELLDPEVMRAGKYHFESEPGIPMSWAERRDTLNMMIQQASPLIQSMGIDAPINAPIVQNYVLSGMPEIRSTQADVRDYVLNKIQVLITQQPTMDPQGGPPMPSLPPDEFVDPTLYSLVAQIAQEWLISPQGQKVSEANLGGYQNALAWAMANSQKAPPATPPPPPPPPPRLSVSLSGQDLMIPGVAEAAEAVVNGQPPPPPPGGFMPPPGADPQGGSQGPPPTNDPSAAPQSPNITAPGPVPVGPQPIQPTNLQIQ